MTLLRARMSIGPMRRAELPQSHHRRTTPGWGVPFGAVPLARSHSRRSLTRSTCTRCGHREISKTLAPPSDRVGLWATRGRVMVLEIDCAGCRRHRADRTVDVESGRRGFVRREASLRPFARRAHSHADRRECDGEQHAVSFGTRAVIRPLQTFSIGSAPHRYVLAL